LEHTSHIAQHVSFFFFLDGELPITPSITSALECEPDVFAFGVGVSICAVGVFSAPSLALSEQ
jgi:hypothetical protein